MLWIINKARSTQCQCSCSCWAFFRAITIGITIGSAITSVITIAINCWSPNERHGWCNDVVILPIPNLLQHICIYLLLQTAIILDFLLRSMALVMVMLILMLIYILWWWWWCLKEDDVVLAPEQFLTEGTDSKMSSTLHCSRLYLGETSPHASLAIASLNSLRKESPFVCIFNPSASPAWFTDTVEWMLAESVFADLKKVFRPTIERAVA